MDAQERYDEIAGDLVARNADVSLGRMMGMPCIKTRGKMIGGFWEGEMVFKLPDVDERERALALEGTHLFDPSARDRPMKEWGQGPATHIDRWPDLAERAVAGPA